MYIHRISNIYWVFAVKEFSLGDEEAEKAFSWENLSKSSLSFEAPHANDFVYDFWNCIMVAPDYTRFVIRNSHRQNWTADRSGGDRDTRGVRDR